MSVFVSFARLTPKRMKLLEFINSQIERTGMAPTQPEMLAFMGLNSAGSITAHLQRLEIGGYIERPGMPPRNIVVTIKGQEVCAKYGNQDSVKTA